MTLTLTYAVKDILLSNFWLRRFSPSFVITSQVIDKKKKLWRTMYGMYDIYVR